MFRGGLPLTLEAPSKQSTPTHRTTRSPSRLHESQAPLQERRTTNGPSRLLVRKLLCRNLTRTTSSPSPVLTLSHSRKVTYHANETRHTSQVTSGLSARNRQDLDDRFLALYIAFPQQHLRQSVTRSTNQSVLGGA